MEPRFGHDFSKVRVHTDEQAAEAASAIGARAFTVANNVVFGRGEFAPSTKAGNQLLAHELTHVIQQQRHPSQKGGVIQCAPSTLESSTSAPERQNIRVLRSELIEVIAPDEIKQLMTDKGETDSLPVDTVIFGPEIDGKIKHGLQNLAAKIFNKSGFTFNTVTNLPLNIKAYGGVNGVYRFTLGQGGKGSKSELIIEQVSDTPPIDWHKIDLSAQEKRFNSFGFNFGIGFDADDLKKHLLAALAHVPDSILARVRGLTFNKFLADLGSQNEPAHYDPNKHTIDLYSKAIVDSANSQDAGGDDWFTAVITHELGHALDDESYTSARLKRDSLAEQLKAAILKSRRVKVDTDAPIPDERTEANKEKNERQEIQKLEDEFNKAANDFDKTTVDGHSQSKAFDKARGKGISSYGEKGKNQEDFAELFSLFVLDPDLLKSLRPDAFAYFSKTFP